MRRFQGPARPAHVQRDGGRIPDKPGHLQVQAGDTLGASFQESPRRRPLLRGGSRQSPAGGNRPLLVADHHRGHRATRVHTEARSWSLTTAGNKRAAKLLRGSRGEPWAGAANPHCDFHPPSGSGRLVRPGSNPGLADPRKRRKGMSNTGSNSIVGRIPAAIPAVLLLVLLLPVVASAAGDKQRLGRLSSVLCGVAHSYHVSTIVVPTRSEGLGTRLR